MVLPEFEEVEAALVGAEEDPVGVALDPVHEEAGHPEAVEEVARFQCFIAVVPPELEEVENVGVPGLQVHGDVALPLPPPSPTAPPR